MLRSRFSGASSLQFGVLSMRGKNETTTNFSKTKGNQTKGFCNNMDFVQVGDFTTLQICKQLCKPFPQQL